MPVHVGGALNYALRQLHENPEDPRVVEMQFDWLNTAKDFIAHWGMWRFLEAFGKITPNSAGIVYFPEYVWSVVSMYPNNFGYRRTVEALGAKQFDDASPGISAGLTDYIINWGWYGVQADVSQQGVLDFSSAGGAGDEGVQIIVEGLSTDAERYLQFETVTLDASGVGQTTASWPAEPDGVRRIHVIYNSLFTSGGVAKTRGVLTVTDAAATTIERIDMSRALHHEHIRAELYPTTTGSTHVYRYFKRLPDILSLDHVIEIPTEFKDAFHYAIMAAVRDFQGSMGEAMAYEQKAQAVLDKLKFWEIRQPGRRRGLRVYTRYRNAWSW